MLQMDQLADMVSTVFMAHSGSNMQAFGLDVNAVAQAAEMSLQSFFLQVNAAAPSVKLEQRACKAHVQMFPCCMAWLLLRIFPAMQGPRSCLSAAPPRLRG